MGNNDIYGVPEADLIPRAEDISPVGINKDEIKTKGNIDLEIIKTLSSTTESAGDKLRRLISAQPSEAANKEFAKETILKIDNDAQDIIKEPTFDITEKPALAEFASLQQLNVEITKAFISTAPNDLEGIITNAPKLEFIQDQDGKANGATAESMARRTEYLKERAVQIIAKARESGADLPKFDANSGEKLPENSILVLKAAVEFLKPKAPEKDYTEISAIVAMAVGKQDDITRAAKWSPGGMMFEGALASFIGSGSNQFTRDEVIAYYNRMVADRNKRPN